MSEFIAYHITSESIQDVVANLAKGLFGQSIKAIMVFDSIPFMNECDKKIWTFSSDQFIPHGTILDKFDKNLQAFYLTNRVENHENFSAICFIHESDEIAIHIEKILEQSFEKNITKVIYMFSGILDSTEYLKIMQEKNIDKKFNEFKFFARQNNAWVKIL